MLRCGEATVCVLRESTGEDGFARLRASHGSCVGESSRGRTDSFAFFFSLGKRKIKVSIPSSRDRATVHRTVAFYFSNPPPNAEKRPIRKDWSFFWWGRTDSNHRSETQQIYSLSPLATRELPRVQLVVPANFDIIA